MLPYRENLTSRPLRIAENLVTTVEDDRSGNSSLLSDFSL